MSTVSSEVILGQLTSSRMAFAPAWSTPTRLLRATRWLLFWLPGRETPHEPMASVAASTLGLCLVHLVHNIVGNLEHLGRRTNLIAQTLP